MRVAFWRSAVLAMLVACGMTAGVAAAPTTGAISAVRFELTIDGHSLAVFSELVGISSVVTTVPSPSSEAAVGPAQVQVVLRRPLTRNIEMAAWHELVILGDVAAARKSASLTAYNAKGDPVARYHLTDAWPQKIEVTTLRVGAADVLMETVTMTCEFLQRVSV